MDDNRVAAEGEFVESRADRVLLEPDEHEVWSGSPVRRDPFSAVDLAVPGLAVVISVLWVVVTRLSGDPLAFTVLGAVVPWPFALLLTRSALYRRDLGQRYVLTDKRIITVRGKSVLSRYLNQLSPATVHHQRPDGTGTLVFATTLAADGASPGAPVRLMQIPHAARVASLVLEQR